MKVSITAKRIEGKRAKIVSVEAEVMGEMVTVRPGGLSDEERRMLQAVLDKDAKAKEEAK